VSEGHPDKVADRISDRILDAFLERDPEARVACETLIADQFVVVAGEFKTKRTEDFQAVNSKAEQSVAEVQQRLSGSDMLIVNKFGKREAEGKGLVPVIGDAVDLGIPILVGVNGLNLAAFLAFAGEEALALPTDVASVVQWCRQSIFAETV
jgi:hypothetical protein